MAPSDSVSARVPIDRHQEEGGAERADDAADGRDAIDRAGHRAGALPRERSISRIANGEYMPKNVTGKNRIAIEATRLPVWMSSMPASTDSSIGCAKSGSTSM